MISIHGLNETANAPVRMFTGAFVCLRARWDSNPHLPRGPRPPADGLVNSPTRSWHVRALPALLLRRVHVPLVREAPGAEEPAVRGTVVRSPGPPASVTGHDPTPHKLPHALATLRCRGPGLVTLPFNADDALKVRMADEADAVFDKGLAVGVHFSRPCGRSSCSGCVCINVNSTATCHNACARCGKPLSLSYRLPAKYSARCRRSAA